MNCRHVQDALSPYIDGRLTGETMLQIQHHLDGCRSCTEEYLMISEAKALLRSLPIYSPSTVSERALKLRVEYSQMQVPGMLPMSAWSPPPRGRRLVTALAMSCLGSLVVAAPFGSGTFNMMAMRPLGFSTLAHMDQKQHVADASSMFAPTRPMPASIMLPSSGWTTSTVNYRGQSPYGNTSYIGSNEGYGAPIGQPFVVAFGRH